MAKDLAEQLNRIGHKAELLVTRFASLKEQNQELRQQVLELQATVQAQKAEIEKQRVQIEHFRISSALAPDTATAKETRAIIAQIVRDIDACVADLMKEI